MNCGVLQIAKKIHISNLETSLERPYFARIDFTSEEDGKTSTIYIEKNGVMKDTNINCYRLETPY